MSVISTPQEPENRYEELPFAMDESTPPEVVEAFLKGPEALDALEKDHPHLQNIINLARGMWHECVNM